MEAAIVCVVVGLGVLGMLQLLAAGTMANNGSTELTTAMGLASNLHEYSLGVKYANVMTLDAQSFSPPVDARLQPISNLTGWTQQMTVNYIDPNNLLSAGSKTPAQPTARLNVSISHNGALIYTTSWLATATTWP